MDEPGKRIDLNSELGVTRRDLIRRGAIVGGTLLWVAPAIQSMAPKAFAQVAAPGSVTCTACYCWNGSKDGPTGENGTFGLASDTACATFCTSAGFSGHEWCKGTDCEIHTGTAGAPATDHAAVCT